MIAKNEGNYIPRMLRSLGNFILNGGDVIVVDTGSSDNTAQIARDAGCTVMEVWNRYKISPDIHEIDNINNHFIVAGEQPLFKQGDSLFDFSSARNYAAALADNDMISCQDADEEYTVLDIDKINKLIEEGYDQFNYNFIFSHNEYGKPLVEFTQSKFYNRKKMKWNGLVHEVLGTIAPQNIKLTTLDPTILKLEHWQNLNQPRGQYLRGLALDCYRNQNNDRNSHYLGRELLWNGRPKSAIKEFERHIKMGRWAMEEAQSMLFIGDAYGILNQPDKQVEYYHKSFQHDGTRREPLIRLADFYRKTNNPQKVVCYSKMAMEIPWHGFYANQKNHYEETPHEYAYWGYGWIGNIPEARKEILTALEYKPCNKQYLRDTKYYFGHPKVSIVIPTLGREDKLERCLKLIKENAGYDNYEVIVEHDSFDNRQGALKTFNRGVYKSNGDLIMFLSNDCLPEEDFLLRAVVHMIKTYPAMDGLVSCNDGNRNGELAIFWIGSKKLLPYLDGNFANEEYNHCYADNELTERCKQLGKYSYCIDSLIKHDHPFINGSEMDEVYKLAYNKDSVENDRILYETRLANGWK
jgi:glycosyltransferase involved in cell wall biosynthesis